MASRSASKLGVYRAGELNRCLRGLSKTLTVLDDQKRDNKWSEWRTMWFTDGERVFAVDYTVRTDARGVWHPFGFPLKNVTCREVEPCPK